MIAKKKSKVSIGIILYFLIYALSGIIIGDLLASYQFGEDFGDFPLYLICFYFVIVISFLCDVESEKELIYIATYKEQSNV